MRIVRADLFDPGDAGAGGERFGSQVPIHHSPRPSPSRVKRRPHDLQRPMRRLAVCGRGLIKVDVNVRWPLVKIIGFGGSVPIVVLMFTEQLQRFRRLGEDADGLGPADIDAIGVAFTAEDVGDPVDGGLEPDGIPGGGPGNDRLQSVLGLAAQPDETFPGSQCGSLLRAPPGPRR